jgi:hypothetical protein
MDKIMAGICLFAFLSIPFSVAAFVWDMVLAYK